MGYYRKMLFATKRAAVKSYIYIYIRESRMTEGYVLRVQRYAGWVGRYYSGTDLQHSATGSEARKRRSPEKTERRAPTGSKHGAPRSLLWSLGPRQDAEFRLTTPVLHSSVSTVKFVLLYYL